jgi:hypothetical protein
MSIKFQFCKMNKSSGALYSRVPIVNNMILCTLNYVKRIDLNIL